MSVTTRIGFSRPTRVAVFSLLTAWGSLAAAAPEQRSDPVVPGSQPEQSLQVISVGGDTLVLSRQRADGTGTEGLVVDSNQLVNTLKKHVLEARGLGEVAELSSSSRGLSAREPSSGYTFTQTFGEPFESVRASLRLRPLADPGEGDWIYPLSLLLGFSMIGGLFALYRMAATQVRFAERRSNFVSAVSHELKTPLTAIRMHAEILDQDLVSGEPKRREYYRTITRESERLSRLIDNVLAFSQIERGTRRLELRVGDVRPCLRESLEVLTPHVEAQGFTLHFDAPEELPSVRFEPDALKQVLFNLVDNALKYGRDASQRSISVHLNAHGDSVILSVRDRGPGVPREHLKHVFEPFFRAENELTRRNQGTGIGLTLVRGLAQGMGADVRAENANPGFCLSVILRA